MAVSCGRSCPDFAAASWKFLGCDDGNIHSWWDDLNLVVYQLQMRDVGWDRDFYVSERCEPRYNVTGADLSFDTTHRHTFVSAK